MIARDPIVRRSKPSRPARAAAPKVSRPAPQASYYSSLGRSVERVANQQRARKTSRPPMVRAAPRTSFSGPRGDVQTGGPRQLERAQAYRTGRPYYKTVKSVWLGTPRTQKALRNVQQAHERYPVKGSEKAQARATRRIATTSKALDLLYRHGPDVLSNEAYRKYNTKLWKRAGKYYPHPKNEPRVVFDYKDPQRAKASAWVYSDVPDVVHYRPETARLFMLPKKYRGQAPSVPLHEWAHTRQPSRTIGQKAKREGGAEALDRLLAKKLKVPYERSPDPEYRRWARKARRKGRRYLLHGQFR